MIRIAHYRAALGLALVLGLGAAIASCSSAPPAEAPPAPPPPVARASTPDVSLSPRIVELAGAYRAYVHHAAAISPHFTDGDDVAQGLKTGASYEPQALLQGAIAYGAIVALQDSSFVANVRRYAGDADLRRRVIGEISRDPAYATAFTGASGAARLVAGALGGDGHGLMTAGRSVKQAAYDVQHEAWSKSDIVNREDRLAQAKSRSNTPGLGEIAETQTLQTAVSGHAHLILEPRDAGPPYSPLVTRALALAALAALGGADDAGVETAMAVLADPGSTLCLHMSKLNLYQCLAVARPHYEDIFCLGQHALNDTGRCLAQGAGALDPTDALPPVATAAPTSTSTRGKSKARGRKP